MRILVAGGAGFVGSHLVDLLLQRGDQVTVIDNLITGSTRNLERGDHGELTFIRGDVENTADGRYDEIYHLASPASPIA